MSWWRWLWRYHLPGPSSVERGDEDVEDHDGADTAVRSVIERLVRGPLVDLSLVTHEETDTRNDLRDHWQNQRNRQGNQVKKKSSSDLPQTLWGVRFPTMFEKYVGKG